MAKHRGELHEDHTDESWLIPYADLLTLLLALFICLYASSNIDQEKYNALSEIFSDLILEGKGITMIPSFDKKPETRPPSDEDAIGDSEEESLLALQAQLEQYLEEQGLATQVSTAIDDRGLVISMSDAVLFDPGSAVIKPEHRDVLVRIGMIIDRLNNFIRIEGHTDTVPMHSEVYPSNWELSCGRAASVVRLFVDESRIEPEMLMPVGYGEFRPIADNTTIDGRSKNRRVDIIVMSSRYNTLEEQWLRE